jgi:ketosteroid isomerase-like protein
VSTDDQSAPILEAISRASSQWVAAFNSGDAAGCAAQYEKTATMHARPFGQYNGTSEIQSFWQNLINDGFSDVEYINIKTEIADDTSAVLSAEWKMNKASGVIHKELWVLQEDGTAKLREDDFEARG